jgi:hypothetical protein
MPAQDHDDILMFDATSRTRLSPMQALPLLRGNVAVRTHRRIEHHRVNIA